MSLLRQHSSSFNTNLGVKRALATRIRERGIYKGMECSVFFFHNVSSGHTIKK